MSGPRPEDEDQHDWHEGGPERLYVVTSGRRSTANRPTFDLVTLVVARTGPEPGMQPEHVAILRMCATPLSIVEISAHLSLPSSTVMLLVGDLLDKGRVEARKPAAAVELPDPGLLEAVMDGLRRI